MDACMRVDSLHIYVVCCVRQVSKPSTCTSGDWFIFGSSLSISLSLSSSQSIKMSLDRWNFNLFTEEHFKFKISIDGQVKVSKTMCVFLLLFHIALSISIVIVGLFNIIWGLKQTITVFVLKSFWKCLFDGLCSSGRRSFVLITHLRIYRPYYDFDEILSFYFFIYSFCFVIRLLISKFILQCVSENIKTSLFGYHFMKFRWMKYQ